MKRTSFIKRLLAAPAALLMPKALGGHEEQSIPIKDSHIWIHYCIYDRNCQILEQGSRQLTPGLDIGKQAENWGRYAGEVMKEYYPEACQGHIWCSGGGIDEPSILF